MSDPENDRPTEESTPESDEAKAKAASNVVLDKIAKGEIPPRLERPMPPADYPDVD